MNLILLVLISALISAAIYSYILSLQNSGTATNLKQQLNIITNPFCSVKNLRIPLMEIPDQKTYYGNRSGDISNKQIYKVKCQQTRTLELRPYVSAYQSDKKWYISGTLLVDAMLKINDTLVSLSKDKTIKYGSIRGNGSMTVINSPVKVKASRGDVFTLEIKIMLKENSILSIDNASVGFIVTEL